MVVALVNRLFRYLPGLGGADGRFLLSRGGGDFIARTLGVGLGLLWVLIVVRLLGADEYGRFVYLLSATFFVSLLGSLGMPVVASLYVARYGRSGRQSTDPGSHTDRPSGGTARLRAFTAFAVAAALIGPVLGALGLYGAVTALGGSMFIGFNIWLVLGFASASALVQLFAAVDRAVERAVQGAIAEQILQRIIALSAIGGVIWLGAPADADAALTGAFTGAVGAVVLMALIARPAILGGTEPKPGSVRRALRLTPRWTRRALVMMVTPVYFLVISETDILMLGAFLPPAAVGIYHVARRLAGFMRFVYTGVIAVGMHRLAAAHMERDKARLQSLVETMGWIGMAPAVGLLLVFVVIGPWILGIFGPEMRAGYWVLLILSATALVEMSLGPATELLMMTGHEKLVSRVNILFAIINIGLNAAFVPLIGMEGAAIATGIAVIAWKITLARYAWQREGIQCFILLRSPFRALSDARTTLRPAGDGDGSGGGAPAKTDEAAP